MTVRGATKGAALVDDRGRSSRSDGLRLYMRTEAIAGKTTRMDLGIWTSLRPHGERPLQLGEKQKA